MNPQPLANKVALITGAARGIGYGIARRYAEEGASVVIADINQSLAEASAARIAAETGRQALALLCDVTDRANVDAVIAQTADALGGLDIVVSNAGICPFVEFLELDNKTWQRTIDVILTGGFNVGQAAARAMIAQDAQHRAAGEALRGGRILYITSLSTIQAGSSQVDYAAAKSGERMLMATMAGALGKHNITVNAIAPGRHLHGDGRVPLGRAGEPGSVRQTEPAWATR